MRFGSITVADIAALNLGDVVIQLERIDGKQEGKTDKATLLECANRLDRLTKDRTLFLSRRYEPLRKILRTGFVNADIDVRSDAHLYDATRRLMKNIRGANNVKGELRAQTCSVCGEIAVIAESPEGQQFFPS
jgi:hypothetical protein